MMPLLHASRSGSRSIARKLAGGLLLVGVVLLAGAVSRTRAKPNVVQVTDAARKNPLLEVDPRRLVELVSERYRLKPDHRLQLAIVDVHRLSTGREPERLEVEYQEDRWKFSVGDQELGTLPEIPDFAQATELLTKWARSLRHVEQAVSSSSQVSQAVARGLRDLNPEVILGALAALGDLAGRSDADVIKAATSGFSWLSTVAIDSLEQAGALHGRTWALLAIEKALGSVESRDVAVHEALLANALGYETAAAEISRSLAEDHPVRMFVLRDATRLGAACSQRREDQQCHYLHLALLVERRDRDRFWRELDASPLDRERLPALALQVRLSDFELGPLAGRSLAEAAFRAARGPAASEALGSPAARANPAIEGQTRLFEASVQGLAGRQRGELADHRVIEAFYRAAFYSGLFEQARFYLDRLASGAAARDYAAKITESAPGTATELKRWIELRADVLEAHSDPPALAEAVARMRSIGSVPLTPMCETIANSLPSTDPLRRAPIPALFARLDSRPAHLWAGLQIARRNLTSPLLYEKYVIAAADAAPHLTKGLAATAALLKADTTGLRAMVEDPATSRETRLAALDGLQRLGATQEAFVKVHYEAVVAADPLEVGSLASYLEKAGDLSGAYSAVEKALRTYPGGKDLGWAYLLSLAARIRGQQGYVDEAFAMLEPALQTWKEDVLLVGAALELERGRTDESLRLARATLDRYPDSEEASALIARALWRKRDFAEAAKAVAASRNRIVGEWRAALPVAFGEMFASAPADETGQAFEELKRVQIAPHILAELAAALGRKGDHEVALRLLEDLHDPTPEWNTHIRLLTYDMLRESVDAERARAWIRQAIPQPSSQLALALFQMRKYEALMDLFPAGVEGDKPRIVRTVKAAALLHLKENSSHRRDALIAELERDPEPEDFFVRAALFLLGRTDENVILVPLPDLSHVASVGWLMGTRAAGEGRFEDAEPWFQVALESGEARQPPHAWSFVVLSDWLTKLRSLRLQERGGEF